MSGSGLGKVDQSGGVVSAQRAQEARFGGYSVEIGTPAGVKASHIPEVHVSSNCSIGQMVWDTVTDVLSGKDVGTTKESRKLDALVEYIGTGEAYDVDGEAHVYAGILEKRASALEQVLTSPLATPKQKQAAVVAFERALGVVPERAIAHNDKGTRALCTTLMAIDRALEGDDQALLSGIKKQVAGRILTSSGHEGFGSLIDENRERSAQAAPALQEGMGAEIEILKYGRNERLKYAAKDADFESRLGAVKQKATTYLKETGGHPKAGEAHNAFVRDMVSSLKDIYQDVLQELNDPSLERGGDREAVIKERLNGIRDLATSIVNKPPEAGSTLEGADKGLLHTAINTDLKDMGVTRASKAFIGRTN